MGSDLNSTSDATHISSINQSNYEVKQDSEKDSVENKNPDDLFPKPPVKVPSISQANSSGRTQTLQQPQDINTAVKTTSQLGTSNPERDSNISSHISMSVSGQGRVNNNVSR